MIIKNKHVLAIGILTGIAISIWCIYDGYLWWSLSDGMERSVTLEKNLIEVLSTDNAALEKMDPKTLIKYAESNHYVIETSRSNFHKGGLEFFKIGLAVLLVNIFQLIFLCRLLRKSNEK